MNARLILTSDLHYRPDWMEWLSSHQSDLVAVAGDLLNGSDPANEIFQVLAIDAWCRSFPGRLALSSGNHDILDATAPMPHLTEEQMAALRGLRVTRHWMDGLDRGRVITDARSALIDAGDWKLVVTTIPFHADRDLYEHLWESGATLRSASGADWLVLHHEPPACTSVGGSHGRYDVLHSIQHHGPTYFLCGHIHNVPYYGGFASKVDSTWCFNAGHPSSTRAADASFPNHIIIANGVATWLATGLDGVIETSLRLT